MARPHELPQVLGRGLDGNARKGHPIASGGECYVKDLGGKLGVLVEHLIKIADPIEENRVPVLRLHLPPMLEHWRGRSGAVMPDQGHGGNIGDPDRPYPYRSA
jgi:hypothetical protein